MGRKGRPELPEFVARVVEIGTAELAHQLGVPAVQAQVVMRDVAHSICREYGGQRLSVPQDIQHPLEQRDEQIYRAFDGTNYPELAAKHGLTVQQVRNIIAYVRRKEIARRRLELRLEEGV